MGNLFKPYDKEFMKMAMLKHEETFKEQVYELHRLYQIQKILMRNIEKSRYNGHSNNQERWSGSIKKEICFTQIDRHHHHIHHQQLEAAQRKLDLEQPAEECIAESLDGNGMVEMMDESEIELTLGPTSYNRRRRPEAQLTSDSGPSLSSSSTGSSHINRTSSRTHHTNHHRIKETTRLQVIGCELRVTDNVSACQDASQNNSIDHVEQQLSQERLKQSPWLFQVLSLNMT